MRTTDSISEILVFATAASLGLCGGYHFEDCAAFFAPQPPRSAAFPPAIPKAPPPPIDPEYEHFQPRIRELSDHDIVIVTSWSDGDVGRPIAAEVLAGPVRPGYVRIGDKELTLAAARDELREIGEMLEKDLEIPNGFALIMDTRDDTYAADMSEDLSKSWDELSDLAHEMDILLTPCGIENFEHDGPSHSNHHDDLAP